MTLEKLLDKSLILEMNASPDMEISDISYDSRQTRQGDLFVAIAGLEFDGHRFIPEAVKKGAAAVICEKKPDCDIPYVLVGNSRQALAAASAAYFGNPASRMKLIGVTGTNGKTTVTMLMKHALETCLGAKVGLIGTNQNMIGGRALATERTTPESYELHALFSQMAKEGCEYLVMEVSSHSLSQSRVSGLEFEVGVFTNLTQDHLDYHGGMDEYARVKAGMFAQCKKGVVNADDMYAPLILRSSDCDFLTYSVEKDDADLCGKDIRLAASGVKFCALTTGILERVSLGIPGRFTVYNALAVISCAMQLGIECRQVCQALSTAPGVKGRVEVVPTDGDYTILIDYAHTPDALENVLKSVRETTRGRVVALFGCGGDRDRTKRPIMGGVAARLADFVVITSDNPRTEKPDDIIADILKGMKDTKTPYVVIPGRAEAIGYVIDNHREDDVIILAGKGHETYQIVGKEKLRMDEREIVAEHLAGRMQ